MKATLLLLLGFCSAAAAAALPSGAEKTGSDYTLTVYFTPVEARYTESAGFRAASLRIGVVGRHLSPDFVQAVRMEGYGRLLRPVQGLLYLRPGAGEWVLSEKPAGRTGRTLEPGVSCAIGGASRLQPGDWIVFRSSRLPSSVQSHAWRVDDQGSGVDARQIDLYWGEDVSQGPGRKLHLAANAPLTSAGGVAVYKVPPPS